MNSFSEQIKCCLKYLGKKQRFLYTELGMSSQSWASKIRGGKFSISELIDIATILGAEYIFYFENEDGYTYRAVNYYEIIHKAVLGCGKKMEDLALQEGITRQGLHKKLKKGKLSQEYLQSIADFTGCKYKAGFLFQADNVFID